MTRDEESAIRARDAAYPPGGLSKMRAVGQSACDRRTLLAEVDRLRGLLAEPSEAMVEAAAIEHWEHNGGGAWPFKTAPISCALMCTRMRAALVAAIERAISAHDAEIATAERAKFPPALWWRPDDEEGACYGDRNHVLADADLADDDIIEIRRAAALPSEWAVELVTARDADAFPMCREIRYFATRDEALAAIEGSQP